MFGIVLYPTLLVGLFFGPAFLILDFGVESGFMFGGALAFVALNMVWTKYDRESRDKADKDMTPYPIGGGQTVPMRQWYMHFPECFWRDFHYEYEKDRLAIDIINGGPEFRNFVDTIDAKYSDFHTALDKDEQSWQNQIADLLIYKK